MARLTTYGPDEVFALWGATPLLESGAASGDFITVARADRSSRMLRGIDGENARAFTRNYNGVITLNLMQSSVINTALSAQLVADEATGLSVAPFFMIDRSSSATIASAPVCFIEGWPPLQRSTDPKTVTWTLLCSRLSLLHGHASELDAVI